MFKFNPLTGKLDISKSGGDASSPNNYSHKTIEEGSLETIPDGQQMLFTGDLIVRGDLMVSGEAKEINCKEESFFFTTIKPQETIVVRPNRLLFYKTNLSVQGNIRVLGTVSGV